MNEIVGHGLVGQLVQDGGHRIKASVDYQQLGLGLLLVM